MITLVALLGLISIKGLSSLSIKNLKKAISDALGR